MDEIEENSNISAKNEESKSNHDFSNKKGEKNNKKNKKIKKLNKANNSPKKELRKISTFAILEKINDNSNVRNLSDTEHANLMKILSSQILAMAEQDNQIPIGQKLDIIT